MQKPKLNIKDINHLMYLPDFFVLSSFYFLLSTFCFILLCFLLLSLSLSLSFVFVFVSTFFFPLSS